MTGQYLRRYFKCAEPQDHTDLYAYWFFHGNVCVHVPRIYQIQIIPVIRDPEIADAVDTRDPKVWEEDGRYYMVLGRICTDRSRVFVEDKKFRTDSATPSVGEKAYLEITLHHQCFMLL